MPRSTSSRPHPHSHGHGHGHGHGASDAVDDALTSSSRGLRALVVSLGALLVTGVVQALVAVSSGSVALLADSFHNGADALTALPLGAAFLLGRRAPTRRHTYGYGRAEDLAGVVVVALVAASAVLAGWEAVRRLLDPAPVQHLGWVALAGAVGFVGNELVATYRIRVGRAIGSAALVADGVHARTDGLTSLAVVLGAAGTAIGWRLADPLVGLVITVLILLVLKGAAREVLGRLMDAVDPELVDRAEEAVAGTDGVLAVSALRLRWTGHELQGDTTLEVDPDLSLREAQDVAARAEDNLRRAVPRVGTLVTRPRPHQVQGAARVR